MRAPRAAAGVAALLATAFFWGSNHVVARGASELVPFPAFIFWRWTLALPILALMCHRSLWRDRHAIMVHAKELALLGAVGVGLFSIFLIGGAYLSLAIKVSIINTTTPGFVAVLAVATGRSSVSPKLWAGLAMAFAGALAVVTRGDIAVVLGLGDNIGNLSALIGAFIFAWFTLRLRALQDRFDALTLTTLTAAAGIVTILLPLYLAWLATGGDAVAFADAPLDKALSAIAYGAIAPTLLGSSLYIYGMSVLGPQRAASFIYLAPVAAAALAIVFLGERIAWYHVAGLALVVGGLAIVSRSGAEVPRGRPPSHPAGSV